jgi:LysM repeat protein
LKEESKVIEIICNGDDAAKDKNNDSKKNTAIKRPKNIKQIGDVSSDKKIYIEDYAFSYIHSIAYAAPSEEQAGVLLGKCERNESEECLFIKGVIKARAMEEGSRTGIYFDEKVWNGIYADVEKYFPNLEVVGWFAALPEVTIERMQYLKRLHLDNFAGSMKTMYLISKAEKEEDFYLYEQGDLKKQKGYVCFYERNYEMQEYMLQKRGHRSVESPESDKVMKSIRTIIQEKEVSKQQKRNAVFMYGISSFMIVVVLVIGINLMNSYEKMKNLDQSINNIAIQMSNLGDNSTESAAEVSGNVVSVNKLNGDVYPTKEDNTESRQETSSNDNSSIESKETQQKQVSQETTAAEPATEAESTVGYDSYTVKTGDTIMSICKNYYGTVSKYSEVVAFNHLEDADKLYVGQEIKLP